MGVRIRETQSKRNQSVIKKMENARIEKRKKMVEEQGGEKIKRLRKKRSLEGLPLPREEKKIKKIRTQKSLMEMMQGGEEEGKIKLKNLGRKNLAKTRKRLENQMEMGAKEEGVEKMENRRRVARKAVKKIIKKIRKAVEKGVEKRKMISLYLKQCITSCGVST